MNLRIDEIVKCTKGNPIVGGDAPLVINTISTDTRTLQPGDFFIPIKGDRFDGHDFLAKAIEEGCAGCLVSQEVDPQVLDQLKAREITAIEVDDTVESLGDIARAWREKIEVSIIAVTGSCGKTTTKNMVAGVLADHATVFSAPRSFNNFIGVPLSIARITPDHDFAVIELGMNAPGEIEYLTHIAQPSVGVITNIADAHIGRLGSLRNIMLAKAELLQTMPDAGHVVLNRDSQFFDDLKALLKSNVELITFGFDRKSDLSADNVKPISPYGREFQLRYRNRRANVRLRVFGEYNVANALCATATLLAVGVDIDRIAQGLERFEASGMRSEVVVINGITVVKDFYNANPTSVVAAIRSFSSMMVEGRRVVVLGDMLELGEFSESLHTDIADGIEKELIDELITVGALTEATHNRARTRGIKSIHFENNQPVPTYLKSTLRAGDAVLLKASRTVKFEEIYDKLTGDCA